jgi:hypothetical protein
LAIGAVLDARAVSVAVKVAELLFRLPSVTVKVVA